MTVVEETLAKAGFSTPRMSAAVEELTARQAELQAKFKALEEELLA